MAYPASIDAALSSLAAVGIPVRQSAPRFHRMAWRLGWYVPPPHFAAFAVNVAFFGGCFGLLWGVVMSIAVWSPQGMPVLLQVAGGVAAGVLFGLCMAVYYRRAARKHQLPPWSQLQGNHGQSET
jgi:hypothetical protein